MKPTVSICALCLILSLTACSSEDPKDGAQKNDKSAGERVGEQIVESIKTPLEQAEKARKAVERHNQQLQDNIEKQ